MAKKNKSNDSLPPSLFDNMDLFADNQQAEVERLLALGATKNHGTMNRMRTTLY
jgi:hypothetical protein